MDVVVIRENEEDLYAGIEHQQTPEVVQCLKLVSRPGCERIIESAFSYARAHKQKKVTCVTKANIMKLTDGLFLSVFEAVAKRYPEIEANHALVDIAAAHLAERPDQFDVIVTTNLYGDILSNIAAQVAGSVGMAGSANLGASVNMFEAIHGSAPDIAGHGTANPSGMLKAAILMLSRNGLGSQAAAIENAWLTTLEDGIHTRDIIGDHTRALVGTENFADAIIDRLGDEPKTLAAAPRSMPWSIPEPEDMPRVSTKQELAGVDIFVRSDDRYPVSLGDRLSQSGGPLVLDMVTNRGVKVWPDGNPLTFCTDHWRCRLLADGDDRVSFADVISQLQTVHQAGFQVIKSEHLYRFDGKPGYSLGQGQ